MQKSGFQRGETVDCNTQENDRVSQRDSCALTIRQDGEFVHFEFQFPLLDGNSVVIALTAIGD